MGRTEQTFFVTHGRAAATSSAISSSDNKAHE